MTVSELYHAVAQLGFEDTLEDDSRFLFAANRALLQVNALRPATSVSIIHHNPQRNRVAQSSFTPIQKTEDLCFEATDVKSYYFEADGTGRMCIMIPDQSADSGWRCIHHVDFEKSGGFVAHRGLIKDGGAFVSGPVRMCFSGDYLYSVKNVAMYQYLLGPDPKDVPAYEPYTRYDIGALASDFLSLCSPPIQEDAEHQVLNQGYSIENGRVVLLPYDAAGVYKILYNRRPKEIAEGMDMSSNNDVIDLAEDLCALLPMLIASYIWLDDEPEKAQYYLSLYQSRAAEIEYRNRVITPVPIKNANGW